MNRNQKKKLSRAKRKAQQEKKERKKKLLQEQIEEAEMEMEEFDLGEEEEDVEDTVEKVYVPSYNARSFSELDAEKDAILKAEEVREKTYEIQDIVRNIVWYPEFTPQEKADAIKGAADEFSNRVRGIMESPMSKEANLDALALEVTLARDKRDMSLIESIKDSISKAVLTSSAEDKLSDSKFALVVERDGKKVRKYPIHDKAHVRNALARAAQMIKRGGEAGADAKKALPKIRAAAKKMGIGASTEKDASAVVVEKDANGDWRAVMWVSNNFIDRDEEIISEGAHKEFVEWVNKEENQVVMPAFMTWHTPGTRRENKTDFVDYTNGFLIASAKLTEKEADSLLRVMKKTDLGMSHGSFVLERDPRDERVITKYRMYEVSDLPLDRAANPFTAIETISKEVEMNKKEYLIELLGEEQAEAVLSKAGLKQKELEDAEIESKEVESDPEVETEEVTNKEEEQQEIDIEELKKQITAGVFEKMDIEGLNEFVTKAQDAIEKVPILEDLVKTLKVDKEEELAEMISPQSAFSWTTHKEKNRPSEREDNIAKDDEKILESKPTPGEFWLNDITGTTPLEVVKE